MKRLMSLLLGLLTVVSLILAACGEAEPEIQEVTRVVKETVVEKETVVQTVKETVIETVVEKETVIVAGTPEVVEQEVTKIVEVEKEVVVTATPEPTPEPVTEPVSGGTLAIGLAMDFETFDPYSLKWSNFPLRAQLFDSLIRYDHDLNAHPWLAESWEMSDDGLTVTLELRKGVKFHNGREMVADDVLQNLDKARDPERCLHMCAVTKKIESYEAPDDYTVVIHYSMIDTGWMDFLEDLFIIAPESFDTLKDNPIGTGPYKFKDYIPNDHATFAKNEDYWGPNGPYVDEVVWRPFGNDDEAMVAAFESGALDILHDVPFKDAGRLRKSGATIYPGQPGALVQTLYINPLKVRDKRVRQAMWYALNTQALKETVFYGSGEMYWSPYPRESWAYDTKFDNYYSYDLDKAKALIEEAGAEGLSLTFLAVDLDYVQMATIWRDDLKKIGIDMEIRVVESTIFYEELLTYVYEVTDGYISNSNKDPDRLFSMSQYRTHPASTMIAPDAFWPVHPETGEAYGDLIVEGGSILDREKRKEIYRKIQEIFLEEAWAIAWLRRDSLFASQPYVHGFDWRIDNCIALENVWMEPH
jgi:peptide/nickel transport system substrate-binding protein